MKYFTKLYIEDGAPFIKDKKIIGTGISSDEKNSQSIAIHYANEYCKKNNLNLAEMLHSMETKEIDNKHLAKMVYN